MAIKSLNSIKVCNLSSIIKKAIELREESSIPQGYPHPRILHDVIDKGSLVDDLVLQELWAGLLVSSADDTDDENLIFTRLLDQMTGLQARLLKHVCETVEITWTSQNLPLPQHAFTQWLHLLLQEFQVDAVRLYRETDALKVIGLLNAHDHMDREIGVHISFLPTPLALDLYAKCQGCGRSTAEVFRSMPKRAQLA